MKQLARISLAIVILLGGFLFLPRPASRVIAPDARGAVPTELPSDIKDLLTPSPSPTKTRKPKPPKPPEPPDPDPTKPPPGGGGNDDNNNDKNKNEDDPKKKNTGPGGPKGGKGKDNGKDKKGDKGKDKTPGGPGYNGPYHWSGEFTTDKLQIIAARLKAEGLSEDAINRRVYTPFIIAGPAAWTNTWGAPRYGPGPIVRTHEGQDIFCKYGDPILATESGTIEFDDGGLGGLVARLHREDGSYWYYAHLSGWNTKEFSNGDNVQAGDVIGYCGNTGNAITTPPHVHFGWYQANGESKNPMGMLVKWLREAETRAGAAHRQVTGQRIKFREEETQSRLFGDSFAPDISELRISSEALLAAGSGGGAFGLAEAALQAALASQEDSVYDPTAFSTEGAGHSESRLAEILEATSTSSPASDQSD